MPFSQAASESPACRRFFKALIDDFRSKLSMPVAFSRTLGLERSMKSVILSTCKGLWPVKLEESENGVLFFKDGWEDFVHHHGLMLGDFVVFENKGNMIFHVLAYDASACEKEFPPSVGLADEKNISGRVEKKVFSKCNKGKRIGPQKHKEPLYYIPANPYFVAEISPYNAVKSYVHMPCLFARQNDVVGRSFLTLRDPSKKLWPVRLYNRTKDSCCAVAMGGGLHEFFAANKLKVGDRCMFELNPRMKKSNNIILDVHM